MLTDKVSSLLENKIIKYTVCAASACILSEIGYQWCLWFVKRCARLRRLKSQREITDVIWINELSGVCVTKKSGKNSPHDDKKCKNQFCYTRNIGKLIALIDQAKHTIDLSMYIFTSVQLAEAVHRALKRGVDIRIISDHEMVYASGSQITGLSSAGIPVRFPLATNQLMHHKFCIIDGPNRWRDVSAKRKKTRDDAQGVVFSGSLNWTFQGFSSNWENAIISSNSVIVEKFEEEFERMWIVFMNLNHAG